ncbi:MAG: DNA alkylation repair protein [Prevotella sp.]|nr:DNA alkylation repair protein [Prevotella sp.]
MKTFSYSDERFADLQLLRYRLDGFDQLTLQQKELVYYLSEATLWGRDIIFDQFGRYNLVVRTLLEAVYTDSSINHDTEDFRQLEVYLKRVWFSNGIYHHYGCQKFQPGFSPDYLWQCMNSLPQEKLPLEPGATVADLRDELFPVIFDPTVLPKRVNKADGDDLVLTSACNFYEGVSQQEAEHYYAQLKAQHADDAEPPSFGLNSRLVKRTDGTLTEEVYAANGRYAQAIGHIVEQLHKAADVAESEQQRQVIEKLIAYYETGDLRLFNDYCKLWVKCLDDKIDFINGFIEVYGDPLGMKGSWEGLVEYVDEEATRRTSLISQNAQWFEDHSPVDPRFRKPVVKGVSAKVICAAMLGGDEYPSTAIGINLPNADWIRAEYGSKSISIKNITDAYDKAAQGNGFREEFIIDQPTLDMVNAYADVLDNLHTDLHECLGHGSGQLLPGVDPDALKAYGNTIEEARADLFGLYYVADAKLVELGLTPNAEAWHAGYYTYMMNGLLTQLVRIEPEHQIEEAHMRNRALIARWCLQHGDAMRLVKREGKTYLQVTDYQQLRQLVARLLAEVQRIKSEGDYEAARQLVERYAIDVDPTLHQEVRERYQRLNIAPYKGFINPRLTPVTDNEGEITDIQVDYTEGYVEQMLRYSKEYKTHPQPLPEERGVDSSANENTIGESIYREVVGRIKEIKQQFRLMMDGATAQSMRQKGLDYKINWGATLPRLRELADRLTADINAQEPEPDETLRRLAIELWKENVRECKILATMLMPPAQMLPEVCDIWMEQTPTAEIAEQAAFNLYQHLPLAAAKSFEWIASADDLTQLCGYHVLSRLFKNGQEPNERGINEFIDQALAALQSKNTLLRKAAMQSVVHFASLGLMYQRLAQSAIRSIGLDFLS